MKKHSQEYTLEPARYFDYRDFIKVRFESLKKENPKFSLQSLAQKSGLSKSLIQFLLKKERHLGLDNMPLLAKGLKMTDEEEYFVYLMICKDSSRNKKIKDHFEAILQRIRHQHLPQRQDSFAVGDRRDARVLGDALSLILSSFCRLEGFKEDPQWIKENLMLADLDAEKIKTTLSDLEKDGFLIRNADGRLQTKKDFTFKPDPYDPKGFNLYTKTAALLAELMKSPGLYRPSIYMQLMLSMDEENLKKAELLMVDVHHRLSEMAKQSKAPTASVYFGNYMLTVARLQAPEARKN